MHKNKTKNMYVVYIARKTQTWKHVMNIFDYIIMLTLIYYNNFIYSCLCGTAFQTPNCMSLYVSM